MGSFGSRVVRSVDESALHDSVAWFSGQLKSCMNLKDLVHIYQMPRRSDRLYAYRRLLQDACYKCFRSSLLGDSRRPVVYGFDGRVWVPLLPVLFENVICETLVGNAGAGDFIVRSDWVDKQSKLMDYAYGGVSASPLGVNSSIVAFSDGVYDFSDVDSPVYYSFDARMPVTDVLPYSYDASAGCPLWLSFLSQVLSPSDVLRLQKFLGLGVVHRRVMGHRVEDSLWLCGGGANGKSTILNIVRAVYGYHNISDASLGQLLDRSPDGRMRALYSIQGKIFNICDEVDIRDISGGSDAFKKLCSGEPQHVRGIGRDIQVAYDIPFLILSMNQLPSNRNMDAAFRRRIVRIDFRCSVRDSDMDLSLQSRLMEELPGIRMWMLEGYKLLRRDNFRFSKVSYDESLMEASEQFFDLFCIEQKLRPSRWVGHDERPFVVQSSVLYEKYVDFCRKNQYPLPSQRMMSMDLRRLGYRSERRAAGVFYEMYSEKMPYYGIEIKV